MATEKEKPAVPVPPAPTDGEQPLSKSSEQSIAEEIIENNPSDKNYEEMLRMMQRINDPAYLNTVSMNELYENVYQSRPYIIDSLLCMGTYLFVGAPKVGKSFLMAQLAYHVSMGLPLWNYQVHKGTVLYLALEDDYSRLQERLFRMFGVDGTDNLHFAIYAKQLNSGLEDQLQKFVREHPDTRLIIIDTLQKIREAGGEKISYASDYEVVGKLKQFGDHNSLFYIQGRGLRLKVSEGTKDLIEADGVYIYLQVKCTDDTLKKQRIVTRFLDGQCKDVFGEVIEQTYPIFHKYGVAAPTLRIRDMDTRWGSCISKKGIITLNKRLLGAPRNCIEYVVMHEFCHFIHPNHSKQFYNFLTMLMPDWRERKNTLDKSVVYWL